MSAPAPHPDVDTARLLDHLRDRLPERPDLRLDGVRRIYDEHLRESIHPRW